MTRPAITPALTRPRPVGGIRVLDTRRNFKFSKLFRRQTEITIGTTRHRTIRLYDDTVSHDHATIIKEGEGKFSIKDNGSTNGIHISPLGCYTSWFKVEEPERLRLGMLIRVGEVLLAPTEENGTCPVLVSRHSELLQLSERVYGSERKTAWYLGIGRKLLGSLKARLRRKGSK